MARVFKSELTVSCESTNKSKNYISVLLSIVVLLFISSMIVAAIVIVSPEIATFPTKHLAPREAITLEEAFLHELGPNDFLFQWLKSNNKQDDNSNHGDELLFEDSRNINIVTMPLSSDQLLATSQKSDNSRTSKFQFQPKITTLVANTSLLSSIEYQGFKISPSKRYLLIWTNKKRQFRYSSTARYFIYDIKQDLITLLSTQLPEQSPALANPFNAFENLDSATSYINTGSSFAAHGDNQFTRFQLVDWFSGNGNNDENRDSLVLIQNNDIYLLNDVSGETTTTTVTEANASARRKLLKPQRATFTGKLNEIFNGVPDWLYEEEILGDAPAFQVSPNGQSLAYMSFNDSLVSLMPFSIYGNGEQIIPKTQQIRYPKAGRVNPTVSVHVIDNLSENLAGQGAIRLRLPDDLARRQHYINRIKWLTSDHLAAVWLNRNQNESYILICSRETSWNCEKNVYMSAPGGWLDINDDLVALDEDYYLLVMLKHESEQLGSFKQIARVNMRQQNNYTFITTGPKEVTAINGVNKRKGLVYFTATVENEPGQRQLYSAPLPGPLNQSGPPEAPQPGRCISCGHHPEQCLYNGARMSASTNYYVFECAGPGIPRVELRTTLGRPGGVARASLADLIGRQPSGSSPSSPAPLSAAGVWTAAAANPDRAEEDRGDAKGNNDNLLWTIEDNRELAARLKLKKVMPLTMRLKVPIPNTDYLANVLMLLPPQLGAMTSFRGSLATGKSSGAGIRARRSAIPRYSAGLEQELHAHFTPDSIKEYTDQLSSGQQYPMVVDVYGGPGSQKVNYAFHINFGHYLASSRRTVYAMIDGRGSAFQGTRRMFELYHNFGTKEIQDQIEVANYLAQNFSFIDPNKVGIWGWSYGGYAAAMALAQSNAEAQRRLQLRMRELNGTMPTMASVGADTGNKSPLEHRMAARTTSMTSVPAAPQLQGVFECAASVAPVTSWIYYDTAYTERYMSSPYVNELYDSSLNGDHALGALQADPMQLTLLEKLTKLQSSSAGASSRAMTNQWLALNQTDNFNGGIDLPYAGGAADRSPAIPAQWNSRLVQVNTSLGLNDRYKTASLLEHIEGINRKRFLLIHGTADDNVHFQQSIMLMKQLIRKNVLFESRLYPDQDHAIANIADKLHLGATLSNFFAECFDIAH